MSMALRNVWAQSTAALGWFALPFALALVLTACGGGGESNDAADQTVAVSGVVSDDVIVGATVKLTDLTGKVLGSATTDVNGRYSISGIARVALSQGYKVTSTGGTMAGVPFTATMTAIYSSLDVPTDSNITLITSAVTEAVTGAIPTGASPFEFILKRNEVRRKMVEAGVITYADWNAVAPAGDAMLYFRQVARSRGATRTITGIAADFSVSGARCDSPYISPGSIHVYAPSLTTLRGAEISRRIIGCVAGTTQAPTYALELNLLDQGWVSIDVTSGELLRIKVPSDADVPRQYSYTVVATATVNGKEISAKGTGVVTVNAGEKFVATIGSAGGFVRDLSGHPLVEVPRDSHRSPVTVTATVEPGMLSIFPS